MSSKLENFPGFNLQSRFAFDGRVLECTGIILPSEAEPNLISFGTGDSITFVIHQHARFGFSLFMCLNPKRRFIDLSSGYVARIHLGCDSGRRNTVQRLCP
jgi:hypothetical protein